MENLYFSLIVIVAAIGFAGAFAIIVWLNHLIPKSIVAKYPRDVLIKCKFPLPSKWQALINVEDIPLFKKYRKAFSLWYLFVILIVGLEALLLWLWTG